MSRSGRRYVNRTVIVKGAQPATGSISLGLVVEDDQALGLSISQAGIFIPHQIRVPHAAQLRSRQLLKAPPNSPFIMSPGANEGGVFLGMAFEDDTALAMSGGTGTNTLGFPSEADTVSQSTTPNGLLLDGVAVATAPDSDAWNVAGVLRIAVRVHATDYSSGATARLVAHYDSDLNQRSWNLALDASGNLFFTASSTGAVQQVSQASANPSLVDGTKYWLGVEYNTATGALAFYRAPGAAALPTIWSSWTQVSAHTVAAITFFDSDVPISLGGNGGTSGLARFTGTIYRAQVYDDGVLIADPDFTSTGTPTAAPGDIAYTDSVGNAWTLGVPVVPAGSLVETKSVALGLPVTTSYGLPLDSTTGHVLLFATETDTAFALANTKTVELGLATETDTGLPIIRPNVDLGVAEETDTAIGLTVTIRPRTFTPPARSSIPPVFPKGTPGQTPGQYNLFRHYRARPEGVSVFLYTEGSPSAALKGRVTEEAPTTIYDSDGKIVSNGWDDVEYAFYGGHDDYELKLSQAAVLEAAGYTVD